MKDGFVNRRSGVQSSLPAPRKDAENLHSQGVSLSGIRGTDGTELRFRQAQNQEHLFLGRSPALLRVSLRQYPLMSPSDQAIERKLMARDLGRMGQ